MSIRTFLPGLLLLAALPVFAQAQAPVAETRVAAVADAATTADAAVDRTCLRSTGTRIRPRATGSVTRALQLVLQWPRVLAGGPAQHRRGRHRAGPAHARSVDPLTPRIVAPTPGNRRASSFPAVR